MVRFGPHDGSSDPVAERETEHRRLLGVFGRWFWIVFPYDIEIYSEF
jgi:hypothetical protein